MTDSLQNTNMLAAVEVEVKLETKAQVQLELTLEEKNQRSKQRYLIERCRSGEYKTRAERNATRSIRVVPEKAPEITPEEKRRQKRRA